MPIHGLRRRTFLAALPAGAVSLAAARLGRAGEAPAAFRIEEADGERLRILQGADPVLVYNWGVQTKAGVPERYRRACYCHPVYAPDGTVLTGDFPKDHYHHRGIFWAWPRMKARGKGVQTWHLKGLRQRHGTWNRRSAAATSAVVDVSNDWRLDGGERAGRERVRMVVHPASDGGRAIDFTLEFEAVGGPVELLGAKRKGYGGFCFRFGPRRDTTITVADGVQKEDQLLKRSAWADLSARFGGRKAMSGAAVFVHPANPSAPTGWLLRHYGFLGACWPALEPYTLEPGKPVTLRYRVYVHRGDADEGNVARAYERYADSAEASASSAAALPRRCA